MRERAAYHSDLERAKYAGGRERLSRARVELGERKKRGIPSAECRSLTTTVPNVHETRRDQRIQTGLYAVL